MHDSLVAFTLLGHTLVVTGWKLVGYAGTLLFTGRWFVQLAASRARRRTHVPASFWHMSVAGSLLLLAYFIWGRNDSVGVLSNLFPFLVALYNLWLEARHRRTHRAGGRVSGSSGVGG
jgi:lipid-A-disaccharide synthase-like uncharacterized protein